jgi:hypothetical protein
VFKTILAVLTLIAVAAPAFAGETAQKFGYKPDEFEFKFYMQPRFAADLSGDSEVDNSFRVRRGRVYLTSKVAPNIKALDVYFDWAFNIDGKKPLTLTLGQFKKPFSYQELIMSSSDLNMIDRTAANSFLEKNLFAASRDQGAMLSTDLWEYDKPIILQLGVFHGTGLGMKEDDNSGKQIVGRADVTPVAGLSLGANAALNNLGTGKDTESFLVWGADAAFTKKGLQVVTEAFGGDNYDGVTLPTMDGVPTFLAWYGEAIYRAPSGWQPGARVETIDPNTDADDDGFIMLTGQIARAFSSNFRWQVNVVPTEYSDSAAESETELISQWTVRL